MTEMTTKTLNYAKDNKERMPWEHYLNEFKKLDPVEVSNRVKIPYNEETQNYEASKNEAEESALITKIAMDKFGPDSTEFITAVTRLTLATKESIDSETLDSLSIIFSVYTSLEAIVPGYYVMYLKDSESICILYLEHDKQLAKLYGQSLKAANLQKSWLQEFSIQ